MSSRPPRIIKSDPRTGMTDVTFLTPREHERPIDVLASEIAKRKRGCLEAFPDNPAARKKCNAEVAADAERRGYGKTGTAGRHRERTIAGFCSYLMGEGTPDQKQCVEKASRLHSVSPLPALREKFSKEEEEYRGRMAIDTMRRQLKERREAELRAMPGPMRPLYLRTEPERVPVGLARLRRRPAEKEEEEVEKESEE